MKSCLEQAWGSAAGCDINSSRQPKPDELTTLASRGLLPLDLRAWFEAETLLAWSSADATLLDPDDPRLAGGVLPEGAPNPRTMVTLLSFAYLCGMFDSEEIVRACHTEPQFQMVCGGVAPVSQDITLFRHRSRTLLVPVLLHLLERAARERFRLQNTTISPSIRRALQENAATRLDTARHMDRGEA